MFRVASLSAMVLWLVVPALAQSALPPREREAFAHKGQARYGEARRAFLDLLTEVANRGDGNTEDAAIAEFYATVAAAMNRLAGPSGAVRTALIAAETSHLASRHPVLRDRLGILLLQDALARGDFRATLERTRQLGFVDSWWIVGPFDNERGAGLDRELPPERELDLDARLPGKLLPVAWRPLPVTPPAGKIELESLVRPNDQVLCYAATCLHSDAAQDAVLYLGTGGSYRVFLNGDEVGRREVRRLFTPDQDAWPLRLAAGANLLLVKICDQEGELAFSARLRARDGGPIPARVSSSRADLETAARTTPTTAAKFPVDLGARATFARAAEGGDEVARFRWSWLRLWARADDEGDETLLKAAEQAAMALGDLPEARLLVAQCRVRRSAHSADVDDNPTRRDLEAILGARPDHVEALLALARRYLTSVEAIGKAEELVERAAELAPGSAHVHLLRARLLFWRDLPQLALAEIRAAARPGSAGLAPLDARRRLADALEELDDLDGAQALWEGILATSANPPHLFSAAELALRQGRWQAALELWRRVVQVDPYSRQPRFRIARLLAARGDREQALEELVEWLRLCPDDDEALVAIAQLHGLLGERDHQREALRAALLRNPNLRAEERYLRFLETDEVPFYEGYRIDPDVVLAADPGPPEDAATANDPYYYLLRNRVVRAYRNGTTSEFGQLIVRVLNDEGGTRMQRYGVSHFRGEQSARLLRARVIKADGSERTPRLRGAYLALPALVPGDVIDLEYRIDDRAPSFFGEYFGLQHFFAPGDGAPTQRSALTVLLDPGRDYGFQSAAGAPEVDRREGADGVSVCRYEMRQLPRRVMEPSSPPPREREPVVRITTFRDWNHFAKWWWNLIRKQVEVSPAMRSMVANLTEGLGTERAKIAAIYRFVTTDVRYEAWEFGVHGYKPYSAPVIFERRHGDCKDKAVLLTTMLGALDITAYPVLIWADPDRPIDDLSLPLISHFNHCISYLPATENREGLFLDGTATWHPTDTVPEMDQGARVLVVRGPEAELRQVPWILPENNLDRRSHSIALAADGSAQIAMELRPSGNSAVGVREDLGNEPGRRRELFERRMSRRFGKIELRDLDASDPLDLAAPVYVKLSFAAPEFTKPEGDRMLVRAGFRNASGLLSLAARPERQTALVLGIPSSERDVVRYRLPPGWDPVRPPPTQLETSFARFSLTCAVDPISGELAIERSLQWRVPRIEPEEYLAFREFVTAMSQADDQRVVLRRRKEGK